MVRKQLEMCFKAKRIYIYHTNAVGMLLMLVTLTSAPVVLTVKFHENLHANIDFLTFQFGRCLVNLALRKCRMMKTGLCIGQITLWPWNG